MTSPPSPDVSGGDAGREVFSRPVLIGEAPSKGGDRYHRFPLSGPPARVLCGLAAIPPDPDGSTYGRWTWALYDRFECRNVYERFRHATPWSVPGARERARRMTDLLEDGRIVVCLGRKVHAAVCSGLDLGAPPDYHEWVTVAPTGTAVVAIPHPSGLNRLLNDAEERARSGKTLVRAMTLAQLAR